MRLLSSLALLFGGVLSVCGAFSVRADEPASPREPVDVAVGIVDTFNPRFFIDTYTPLIERLKTRYPQYRFTTVEFPRGEPIEPSRLGTNGFVILSSGDAVRESDLGLQQIATRRRADRKEADRSVGAVFLVRAGSTLKTLADLKGRSVATTDPNAFEGSAVPKGELAEQGEDPEDFFGEVFYTEWNYPDVLQMVTLGMADVGILSTCEWEDAVAAGVVEAQELRIVNERTAPGDRCRRSTALYPDLMLAALPTASPEVVRDITIAVLTQPVDEGGYDWISNTNLTQVRNLYRTLREGPYAYLRDWSAAGLWRRFHTEIALGICALFLVGVHIVRVNLLVRRRTRQLQKASAAREAAAEALRESRAQLERLERGATVTQLSAMFAHEVKQPVTNAANYLNALLLMKKRGLRDEDREESAFRKALSEIYRAADILDRVRAALKRERTTFERFDLAGLPARAIRHSLAKKAGIPVDCTGLAAPAFVLGDAMELELVLVNLLNNAVEALTRAKTADPRIRVTLRTEDDAALLRVEDNGPGVPSERLEKLGKPVLSEKPDGLGFGLAIAASLAEAHGGRLRFEAVAPSGLAVTLSVPLDRTPESKEQAS